MKNTSKTSSVNASVETAHRIKAISARHGLKQYRIVDAAIRVLDSMSDSERLAAINQPIRGETPVNPSSGN